MPRHLAFVIWLTLSLAVLTTASTTFADTTQPRAHLSQDPRVNQAREFIHHGQPQSALEILRPLADAARDDVTDIRFLIGLAAIKAASRQRSEKQARQRSEKQARAALLDEAIAALRAILLDHPRLLRVRLELARAFFLKGDDELSARHFNLAMAAEPPPAVVANVNRFLYAMRARRRWSGYFSLNIEQNDNINNASETRVIYLFGLPFTLDQDSRPRAETGVTFAGGVEYQYPLTPAGGIQAGHDPREWRWRFGVDASRSEYGGGKIDQTYLQVRSGPRYQFSVSSEASLQAVAGWREIGGAKFSRNSGLRLDARHQLSAKVSANGGVRTDKIRHHNRPAADFDAREIFLGGAYLFSPLLQGNVEIGAERRRMDANGDSRARTFAAGVAAILSRRWTLGGNLEWSRRRHQRAAFPHGDPRVDRIHTAQLFALNRRFTIGGFSPQLIITYERGKSNDVLQTYQKTRADLRLVRQF